MKKLIFLGGLLALLFIAAWLITARPAAALPPAEGGNLVRGAMLYDNWIAVLGVSAPQGNMPLWETQSTSSRSGPDTWRCVTCHGWDYRGKEGAYSSGSNYTGFPGLFKPNRAPGKDEILAALTGKTDSRHDFSAYLDAASLTDLSLFLESGLTDDAQYIDLVSRKVIGGDAARGKQLYETSCASCHGTDGKTLIFRYDGRNASLGTLAVTDPWRFLHKTRFGTPGTEMTIGYDLGWTAQDGRDVLLYAQSLPSGLEINPPAPAMSERPSAETEVGGPPKNTFAGILTGIGAMIIGLGWNLIIFGFLIGFILLLVWLIRSRKAS